MFYVIQPETFHTGEIVEMTDHMKEFSRLKENYILRDDKFLIKKIDTNGILTAQNIRNNKNFLFRDVSLQHIAPDITEYLL